MAADPPVPEDSASNYVGHHLESLDLFGKIKTISPSEYFLCEIQDKKEKKINVMQIDKKEDQYQVVLSNLEMGEAAKKIVPN